MIVGCAPFRFSASSYASAPIRTMMLSALLPPTQTHILLLTIKAIPPYILISCVSGKCVSSVRTWSAMALLIAVSLSGFCSNKLCVIRVVAENASHSPKSTPSASSSKLSPNVLAVMAIAVSGFFLAFGYWSVCLYRITCSTRARSASAMPTKAASTVCGRRTRPEHPLPFSKKSRRGNYKKYTKGFLGRAQHGLPC